jgi:hypothetical protein
MKDPRFFRLFREGLFTHLFFIVWSLRVSRTDFFYDNQEVLEVQVDTRQAQRQAQRLGLLRLRPLVQVRREIEKHFADFGLEPDFVSHNTMRGLSGGQKVKIVVLTSRLDEPTSGFFFSSRFNSYSIGECTVANLG